jgi:glutamine synthetase
MSPTKEDILQLIDDQDIKFIYLWFTDILGMPKSFAIPSHEVGNAIDSGMGFDGSSIEGFTRIQESDMIAMPDPSSFRILPWKSNGFLIGRMFCDVLKPEGSPYEGDPRYILKRNLQIAADKGFTMYVGPELEFFYFPSPTDPTPLDRGGYFDLLPLDFGTDLRKETIKNLEDVGIEVEYSHHEVGMSQHEIDLRYKEALAMADSVMTYKLVVKRVAHERGIHASFMPKPIFGINGSGMHTHQSLFQGENNAFFGETDEYNLSDVAKYYIAGLLTHAREITCVTNQWVNSYKRLVPGFEAPVYVSWARKNRSALVRVPEYKPGKELATRVEFRSPDPACNPYLAFSVMLRAGLAGIENKYELSPEVGNNIYDMNDEERRELGIESLPSDLWEAINLMEQSELVREALGEHIFNQFLRSKKITWEQYRCQISRYEIEHFLPIL